MPNYTEHEFLELQEHIRIAAATAQTCRQFSQTVTDSDLRSICENEAQIAQRKATKLMSMVGRTGSH